MNSDGSLIISVDLDQKEAEKELQRLKRRVLTLEEDLYRRKGATSNIEEAIKKANDELERLKNNIKLDDSGKGFVISPEDAKRISDLKLEVENLIAQKGKAEESEAKTAATLEREKELYGEIEQIVAKINEQNAQREKDSGDGADEEERAARAKEKMLSVLNELKDGLAIGFKGILAAPFELLGNSLRKLPSLIRSVFQKGAEYAGLFVKGVVSLANKMNVFGKATDAIAPKLRRISNLAKRVFFFSVITAGFRQLRKTISAWLTQNDELAAALGRLKGVLATAFEPIFSAVIPALTTLLNVLTQVVAAVAQFIAMVFGKTATQAQDNAKALNDQADATKKAGGAASKASKQLAKFDEINQLSDKGGGADATAATFDFDFKELEIEDWGQFLSDALDKIIEKLQSLPELLSTVAQKINEKVHTIYEALSFEGLDEKMSQIGQLLAEALNEMISKINWYEIGATLGAGLQLAISFLVGFIYSFNWQQLGWALAGLINGIVAEIDWYEFGMLLWAKFKMALETLAGLLLNLDMKKLAEAASNIVKGFFDSMTQTLQNIQWFKIGEQVRTFLVNTDWAGIAQSVFTAIGSAFGAAASFLWGLIHDAWQNVVNWWHDTAFEDGKFTFDGLLEGIVWKIDGIRVWLEKNVFEPIVNGFKSCFKINSPSLVFAELGGYLIDGLFQGLSNIGNRISQWGTGFIQGIKNVLGIASPSKEMEEVGEYSIMGLEQGFKDLPVITQMFNTEILNMTTIATAFSDTVQKLIEACYKLLEETMKKAEDITRSATNNMATMFRNMAAVSVSAINSIINALNSIPREITTVHTIIERTVSGGSNLAASSDSVPHLARGAVIPPNREFLAVLGDQRHGTNIEAPLDTIVAAFRAVQGNGGNGREIVLQLDRRELGRAVIDVSNLESQRVGISLGGV